MFNSNSIFLKVQDPNGNKVPMDTSSITGSLVEGAVGGTLCGIGIFTACRIISWINKLIKHR